MFGPHTAKLLRAARATGIDARASRDAGAYLCNYLSWRAIEATCATAAAARGVHPHSAACAQRRIAAQGREPGSRWNELVDAGEAMLMEMVKRSGGGARNGRHFVDGHAR